jgi:cyclic beta-1,2-glucan synthetase
VPGLGLKRGLADDLVVAPYATALAALVHPTAAAANLRRLVGQGLLGPYGCCEAVDYTPRRPEEPEAAAGQPAPDRRHGAVVRAWFAHHQGMTLVALADALTGHRMVQRFHSDPRVQATELLLQERAPRHAGIIRPRPDEGGASRPRCRRRRCGASARPTPPSPTPTSSPTATTRRWSPTPAAAPAPAAGAP